MKKRIKQFTIWLIMIFVTLTYSCNDYLDVTPEGTATTTTPTGSNSNQATDESMRETGTRRVEV